MWGNYLLSVGIGTERAEDELTVAATKRSSVLIDAHEKLQGNEETVQERQAKKFAATTLPLPEFLNHGVIDSLRLDTRDQSRNIVTSAKTDSKEEQSWMKEWAWTGHLPQRPRRNLRTWIRRKLLA